MVPTTNSSSVIKKKTKSVIFIDVLRVGSAIVHYIYQSCNRHDAGREKMRVMRDEKMAWARCRNGGLAPAGRAATLALH